MTDMLLRRTSWRLYHQTGLSSLHLCKINNIFITVLFVIIIYIIMKLKIYETINLNAL